MDESGGDRSRVGHGVVSPEIASSTLRPHPKSGLPYAWRREYSNFYPVRVVFEDDEYTSVEAAYQAAKTLSLRERYHIRLARTPAQAKLLGRRVTLRPGWDSMRIVVMRQLVEQKFRHALDLRGALLNSPPAPIVEVTHWHDQFWGICTCMGCGDSGENWLGRILVDVRAVLKAGP